MIITKHELNRLREQFPKHARVKFVQMNEYSNAILTPGELGSVVSVDDYGNIHVSWDCDRDIHIATPAECERLSFDLMMCCLGNGTTLVNRAVWENNDYKTIGHISNAGNINYRIDVKSSPVDAERRISEEAERMRKAFRAEFEALPLIRQYECILDELPERDVFDYMKSEKLKLENLAELREHFYSVM